ncbi:organ specific protein [Artemisia annua]|uniref:Organ specific protein n=1 Tax=Artemisia annua TaxID=35608 RepID=A0A2U1M887_ARTAN|nr:organ specific protein [Artemisia annua]
MESSLSFFALFSLIMIANVIDARPNPGEYKPNSLPTKKSHCLTNEKKFEQNKDFEPRPNISVYEHSEGLKAEMFDKDFEPRPNISTYDNGASLNSKKTSQEEFEPRPNISVYDNGVGLNGKKTLDGEFEPRPNISVYNG